MKYSMVCPRKMWIEMLALKLLGRFNLSWSRKSDETVQDCAMIIMMMTLIMKTTTQVPVDT